MLSDATETKMYLRMEFESGLGPTYFIFVLIILQVDLLQIKEKMVVAIFGYEFNLVERTKKGKGWLN